VAAFGGFAGLASYRSYFIGLAGLALIYLFFTTFWTKYSTGTGRAKFSEIGSDEIILTLVTVVVLATIFFPYLRGVKPAAERTLFEGRGIIIHVDKREGKITLDHGLIECLMPAISMEYDIVALSMLQGFQAGDRVGFLLEQHDVDLRLVRIWPEKEEKSG
jgi:Cu/Ag efflux protein CusF